MKVLVVLVVAVMFAQDSHGEEAQVGDGRVDLNGMGIIPPDNFLCRINYDCKRYKWYCLRSEFAFCVENKCQCFPRYHFGYRSPYHKPSQI